MLEILIPADAKRVSSLAGRKCRAERALVVRAIGTDKAFFQSTHDSKFLYRVGEEVKATLDLDNRVECTSGVHFFMEETEAAEYGP